METFIAIILGISLISYFIYSTRAGASEGKLFFSKWLLWLGLTFLTGLFILIYVLLTNQIKDEFGEYLAITLLVIFLLTTAISSLLEYKYTHGNYDINGMSFNTPWSEEKKFLWSEVTKVTYNDTMQYSVFHLVNNQKIRISSSMTGFEEFHFFLYDNNLKFERE